MFPILLSIPEIVIIFLYTEVKAEGDKTFCRIEIFLIIINLYSHKVKFAPFVAKYRQISRFRRGSKKLGTSNTSGEEFIISYKNYSTIHNQFA